MAKARSVQTSEREPSDVEARIVSAIASAGPRNVAEVSRITRVHAETVRYKINKRFGRLGFRFHAEVDIGKLGLVLHQGVLNFARGYGTISQQVLRALNEVGYLTYFAKVLPQGHFVAYFMLPDGKTSEYEAFLTRLRERGILAGFSVNEVVASRHKTMDSRFFNFKSGIWEIPWSEVSSLAPAPLLSEKRRGPVEFDYQDLLTIKELQVDARQHLTSIAKKLKLNQKVLEYHYRTHVQGRGLVPSYRIRWAQDITKKLVHSVATTRLTFRGLSHAEYSRAQTAVSKIPFLWAEERLQDGTYIATMYIPLTEVIHVLNYINETVPEVGEGVEMSFVNPSCVASFTIPYNMYHNGRWRFNAENMEEELLKTSATPVQK